jgi:putative resolvase
VAGRWLIPESEVNRLLGIKPIERKRAIMYARVFSSEQKEHLTSQAKRLRNHAEEEKGYKIVKVYEEVASGLNENRRKLQFAYGMLRENKADLVLVEFKDRLSRFGFNYLKSLAESYCASVEVVNGDVSEEGCYAGAG